MKSRTVSAVLGLQLVGPRLTNVPLSARLRYSRDDPYAVHIAFHVPQGAPVEWLLARDLLAAGISSRAGVGDVTVWPSAGTAARAVGDVLNIEVSSPAGRARLKASATEISDFLRRTYQLIPAGEESEHFDADAELAGLLGRAS
jgi:hypothetical protein